MSAADQARREADLKQVAERVALLREQLVGTHHRVGMTALLSLFIELALQHECCTEGAAAQAGQVAFLLAQRASQPPSASAIH